MENQVTPTGVVIYTSDRGDRYKITAMQTSHLINVIGHHMGQQATLRSLAAQYPHPVLNARVRMLDDLILTLKEELIKREVTIDEYLGLLAP